MTVKSTLRRFRPIYPLLLIVMLVPLAWVGSTTLSVATGYSAKILCSGIFVSGRSHESLVAEDLEWFGFLGTRVNRDTATASASFLGLISRSAVYREGLGCSLTAGTTRRQLLEQARGLSLPAARSDHLFSGDKQHPFDGDAQQLKSAIDRAFAEPDPTTPRRTRALVVVHRGRLIAERYAPGFSPETRLGGWSMTKSVLAVLVGIRLAQLPAGTLDQPAAVPEWQGDEDPRSSITLDHLLRMSSGLRFQEIYAPPSDATRMLFIEPDAAAFAASSSLGAEPGALWSYSSGTSNIISRWLRHSVKGPLIDYLNLPRKALFDPIGMASAVMEPDPSGTFVASSFLYATARDWARFGLLCLNDGVWEGRRIVPEGWLDYCRRVTPGSPRGRYGAHFWLNRGDPPGSSNRVWPSLPPDAFFASGFEGQTILMIPSRDLVVVRLGLTHFPARWSVEEFASTVLSALPGAEQQGGIDGG